MSRGVGSRCRTGWSWSLRPLRNVRIIHLSISFGAIKVYILYSRRTIYWHFRGVDACVKRRSRLHPDTFIWLKMMGFIYIYTSFFVCVGGFLFSILFVIIFVCLFLTEINFEMGRKRNLRRAFPTAPGWGIRSAGGCWRHSAYQNCNTHRKIKKRGRKMIKFPDFLTTKNIYTPPTEHVGALQHRESKEGG